jgi:hypothetical protein
MIQRTPDIHGLREQRFKDWYQWRPIHSRGDICPRRVAGKQCRHYRHRGSTDCICNRSYNRLFDHCALWKDENGELLFTTEPYHYYDSDLAALSNDLSELGLEAEVLPRSGWNPWRMDSAIAHQAGRAPFLADAIRQVVCHQTDA